MLDFLRSQTATVRARMEVLYADDLVEYHRAWFVLALSSSFCALLIFNCTFFMLGAGILYDLKTALIIVPGSVLMASLMAVSIHLVLTGRGHSAGWIVVATMTGGVILAIIFFGSITKSSALTNAVGPIVIAYCVLPRREAIWIAVAMPTVPALVHVLSSVAGVTVPDYTSATSPEWNFVGSAIIATVIAATCMTAQTRSGERLVATLAREREQYADLADRDALTGLANRRFFEREIARFIENSAVTGETFTVLFLDLDQFKPINDTYGHDVGDEVLRQTALRLVACFRDDDVIARFGGDEFAVILADSEDTDIASATARVEALLNEPMVVTTGTVSVGTSIGVAHLCDGDSDPSRILTSADASMYQAKRARQETDRAREIPYAA